MTLEKLTWNVEVVKSNNFEWFQMVIDGYVESGRIPKPAISLVKKTWEKITGQTIKKS